MWRQTRTYILGNEGKLAVETWRVLSETLTKTQFLLLVGSYFSAMEKVEKEIQS